MRFNQAILSYAFGIKVTASAAMLVVSFMNSSFADSNATVNVDFSRQIRPILAKQCFSCHGPDKQESGVALHEFSKAISESDSGGKPIVPGDLKASEIIRRIASDDPDVRMPPEGTGLSKQQVELFKNWIQSGAEYREHWAFLPLSNPVPPVVAGLSQASNPIDAFVQDRWNRNSLKPAPLAEPRTLVRRLLF